MNKNNQFVKKIISLVMVLAVLLPLLAFPVSAVNPQKKSLIDRGQLIPDNEEADVNMLMMSPDFVVEAILVTSALEQMPSREELKKDTENLINTFQYGLIDGEKIGSVFLYVNRVPSTGKVQMAVVPTMKQEANYTNYQVDFMERTLQEVYEKAPDIDILIYNFMSLLKVYYYPVINEMGANFFTDDVIQAASEEIVAWRKKYQQNIVLLLNHGFPDGLYDKYADDYFISQGYGIGENNSGVFLIFDDKTGRFDIRFYGTANKGFTQEQLQGLVDEIALKLEGYDVLAIVHIIERFLEPNESIPLVNLDANPNPEEHVDNPELEFPEFRPAFYVVNNQNVLSPEDEELLGLNASAFRFAAQANFVTIVFHPEEMTKDEMQTAVESMYEKWYGEEDGIAVFFDQMSKEIVYHTVGSMKELYDKNKEEVDNLLSVLKELTKENDFSAEDIVFYQQSLMELLYTLYAEQQDMAHFIDESGVFTNLQFTDSVNLLKGKSPYVAVYNKSDYTGYETLDDWLANYQEVLNAAGFKEERVIMAVQFDKDEFALSYSGDNESIRNIVENELKPSVQKEVEANEVIGGIDAFYDLAAEKLAGVSGLNNENSTNEGDAILADLETELKEKANEFKKIVMIVIIALVVILVFFVILIVFAVRASKKKKQNQAAMQYQANPMYPQNQYDNNAYGQSGAGYGQGYDNSGFNQGNMNYDQGTGYGQGYDNSGFAQGNVNNDQGAAYNQGFQPDGFGYSDGFGQEKKNDME
ncbi:MAG: TPM domain-containing protein [Eubacteriales bacterium]|nr:TPM domain-containing protein [Eubacteriales bacterium]